MPTKNKARSRAWCFTVNNPVDIEYDDSAGSRYLIVGDEVGEEGTPHHQGYIYFDRVKSFAQMKELLPDGAHIERAQGSPQQNKDYCSKENVLVEIGELPVQGRRTDFERVREAVEAGETIDDIIEHATSYQSIRSAEIILRYREPQRDWEPEVHWIWGVTGSGKTKFCMEEAPEAWWSGKSLRWWDGYDAHEDVVIDDFRGDFCTFHELLRILDRYPYRVETKGGSRSLLAKRIFITCPMHPLQVYNVPTENKLQLIRRINEITKLDLV